MNRFAGTGLSVLLFSALVATAAHAETRIERQLQLTHPAKIAQNTPAKPAVASLATPKPTNAATANPVNQENLSERDRLILERQRQIIIPAR